MKKLRLWQGLKTPKPFKKGQYLVNTHGSYSKIIAVGETLITVILENGLEIERRAVFIRMDIKEGYTRQINETEMKLFRMLYE